MTKFIIVGAVFVVALIVIVFVLRRGKASTRGSGPARPRGSVNPSSASARLNWLVGRGGELDDKTFHIGTRTVTIGRGVSNFVQITDDNASRVHCQLTPLPYGLQVKDMGSANGTLVNGERIETYVLKDGDELRIGDVAFEYKRNAQYTVNAGLEGKKMGTAAMRATMMGESMSIGKLARNALDEHGGDVAAAAASMGVEPELFVQMLEKK